MQHLSHQERVDEFGLECADCVEWLGGEWSPGGEHVRVLRLKNVGSDVVRFRYRLPSSKLFFLHFPEITALSPGMTAKVIVHFRPTPDAAGRAHVDQVHFDLLPSSTSQGNVPVAAFRVTVRALPPAIAAVLPEQVDFGLCSVECEAQQTFALRNTGHVSADFAFFVPDECEVDIEPSTGVVQPGATVLLTATFRPTAAAVLDVRAVCMLSNEDTSGDERELVLRGTSKFSFIVLEPPTSKQLDFGAVLTDHKQTLSLRICNKSHVVAEVTASQLERHRGHSAPFSLHPYHASIEPGKHANFRVTFAPTASGTTYRSHFRFRAAGGNVLTVECVGEARTPIVEADRNVLEFGDVRLGSHASQRFTLRNTSNAPADFEFDVPRGTSGADASFSFHPAQGTIPALLSTEVIVKFHPTQPINYYKRAACLVLNALEPVCVDLVGTSFTDDVRPAPLLYTHVLAHLHRRELGLERRGPKSVARALDELCAAHPDRAPHLRSATLQQLARDEHDSPDETQPLSASDSSVLCMPPDALSQSLSRLFQGPTDPRSEAQLEERMVDFGGSHCDRPNPLRVVHVTNRSDAKLLCTWDLPGEEARTHSPFVVLPAQQDIMPGQTVQFKVGFRPSKRGFYYSGLLECYCYYKQNRSFRLVDDDTFVPPVCLQLPVTGHTFAATEDQFLPNAAFDVAALDFTPTRMGHTVFQSCTLRNFNDTPLAFQFDAPTNRDALQVWPSAGVVPPNATTLVVFQFTPQHPGYVEDMFRCRLNNSPAEYLELPISCTTVLPDLEIEGGRKLDFPPTSCGMASKQEVVLRNRAALPCAYHWRVPRAFEGVFSVEPSTGTIGPNERFPVTWSFAPRDKRKVRARVACTATLADEAVDPDAVGLEDDGKNALYFLELCGEGGDGALAVSPSAIDFETVELDRSGTIELSLRNTTDCMLAFEWASHGAGDDVQVAIEPASGELPPRGTKAVFVRATPRAVGEFAGRLECSVLQTQSRVDATVAFRVKGWFPQVRIVDARYGYSSPHETWQQFSVDAINDDLAQPLSELEHSLNVHSVEREAITASDVMRQLPQRVLHFGGSLLKDAPQVLFLELKNVGDLPAEWGFELPGADEAKLEGWADTDVHSHDEVRQQAILEHRLFRMSPERGALEAGESVTVRIMYVPKFSGVYELPVLLQTARGKRVCLKLAARTTGRTPPQLTLLEHQTLHRLADVQLGLDEPDVPVQGVVLVNDSTWELEYEVDTGLLQTILQEEHYGFDVLRCLNPTGKIPARSTQLLNVLFAPLEEREYEFPLVVATKAVARKGLAIPPHVDDDAQVINVCGRGVLALEGSAGSSGGGEQLLVRPEQLVRLSSEGVDFGVIPPNSVKYRIVALKNLRQDRAVEFEWSGVAFDAHHGERPLRSAQGDVMAGSASTPMTVSVQPERGVVQAGETVLLRVKVVGGSRPAVWDRDVVCRVRLVGGKKAPQEAEEAEAVEEVERPSVVYRTMRHKLLLPTSPAVDAARSRAATASMHTQRILSAASEAAATRAHRVEDDEELLEKRAGGGRDVAHLRVRVYVNARVEGQAVDGSWPYQVQAEVEAAPTGRPVGNDTAQVALVDVLGELLVDVLAEKGVGQAVEHVPPPPAQVVGRPREEKRVRSAEQDGGNVDDVREVRRAAGSVLEKTLFNLMDEAVHGEFDLLKKPREVVTKGVRVE